MSSPPGVRTPPCASLARAHAALGNFATTSPRVSARGAGTQEETGTTASGDLRCPLRRPLRDEGPRSSRRRSQPARRAAHGARAAGARASPLPPPPPRCLKRTKRVSLVGTRPVQRWAAGAGGRRWHPEKRVPGRRGRRPGLLREAERAAASAGVSACAPRPARPSPRAAERPQRQDPAGPRRRLGSRASSPAGRPDTCTGPSPSPASRGPATRPRLKLGSLVLGRESRTHHNRPQRKNSPRPPRSGTFSSLFNYDDFQNSPFRRSLPSPPRQTLFGIIRDLLGK